jgi:hypothetical protein
VDTGTLMDKVYKSDDCDRALGKLIMDLNNKLHVEWGTRYKVQRTASNKGPGYKLVHD